MIGQLEKSIDQYRQGSLALDKLMEQAGIQAYDWATKNKYLGPEKASMFYLSVRERLPDIIGKYKAERGYLKGYLNVCFGRHAKDLYKKEWLNQQRERAYQYHFPTRDILDSLRDIKPVYPLDSPFLQWVEQCKKRLKNLPHSRSLQSTQRRLLCLFLYHAFFIPQEYLHGIAEICDVPEDQLATMIDHLIEEMEGRRRGLKKIHQTINRLFLSLQICEYQSYKSIEPRILENLKSMMNYYKTRLRCNQQKAEKMHLMANQRTIAKLLNIPAGTVSSCVHYARKFIKPLSIDFLSQ
ncbi:MAG: hypothetical protein PF447_06490 [Spirochaetaceae bacterium]|jgi:hypothetical protein|nr:hypothetical protein [Spirochaetaceae bacterium]